MDLKDNATLIGGELQIIHQAHKDGLAWSWWTVFRSNVALTVKAYLAYHIFWNKAGLFLNNKS